MKSPRGKFIVIEGIDGAGTTTQSRRLVDWLEARGRRAAWTCEPTHGPVGAMLRQILSARLVAVSPQGGQARIDNGVIALLFAADRLDHLACEVLPWLQSGTDVVSDRYVHSSIAYQSVEGDLDWVLSLNARARPPDATYFLRLPAEQAAARRSGRASEEIYETDAFQLQVAQIYDRLPTVLSGQEIVIVDGAADPDAVQAAICGDLCRRFGW
ncbi:MAG: dTMP kinase [Deltaproteobacteria bacterium]|nr:dTMP kinase [Deltaproteobacteria bacterium]